MRKWVQQLREAKLGTYKKHQGFHLFVTAIKESFRLGPLTRNKAGYQGIQTTKKMCFSQISILLVIEQHAK